MASKYHNLSNEALADEIGRVDAIAKAAEAELKALKDEFKARGLKQAAGEKTEVTAVEQTALGFSAAASSRRLGCRSNQAGGRC
jgi:hypothetical protein